MVKRVALLGAHGHGEVHLRNVARLAAAGRVELVGVADPRPPTPDQRALAGPHVPWAADAEALLRSARPDVTVVCTPIALHVRHALAALDAGSHLLLEKPPTSTLADFRALVAAVEARGAACQVGFQGLGSHALRSLTDKVARGDLGRVNTVGVLGEWLREPRYFTRSPWAGRREVGGVPTLDGAVTNPFAHGLAAALALDGSTGERDVESVETALFHANPVETDDTSSVRVRTRRGTVVTVAVTLCAAEPREPRLVVRGTDGSAELVYTEDFLRTTGRAGTEEVRTGRTDLLDNLLDHLDGGTPLLAPLDDCGAFMAVVEQVRLAPPARQVSQEWVVPAADGTGALTVPGIHSALQACVDGSRLLTETGVEWTQPEPQAASASRGEPA